MIRQLLKIIRWEEGTTAVEYAVMLMGIVTLVFMGIQILGCQINLTFWRVGYSLR